MMITFLKFKYRDNFQLISSTEDLEDPYIKNIKVICNLCVNGKTLSTSKTSTSNLLRHLKNLHSNLNIIDDNKPFTFPESKKRKSNKRCIKKTAIRYTIQPLQEQHQKSDRLSRQSDLSIDAETEIRTKDCRPSPTRSKSLQKQQKSDRLSQQSDLSIVSETDLWAKDCGPSTTQGRSLLKQQKLDSGKRITFAKLKSLLVSYIAEDMKPLSSIESPAFVKLLKELCPQVEIPCKEELANIIETQFNNMNQSLLEIFQQTEFVCTTADVWTANGKSFFGMTAHWICTESFKRKKAALACCRLNGPSYTHNDDIASHTYEVHSNYNLTSRVTSTVIDNTSNVEKSFTVFNNPNNENVDGIENLEEGECQFIEIDMEQIEPESILLPMQKRCASHTFNLVCKDIEKALLLEKDDNIYITAISKCFAMWNKAKSSTYAVEIIEQRTKLKFFVPTETRWNSQFNAICKIIDIDIHTLNNICTKIEIKPFNKKEILLLTQYVLVVRPLAEALNILQDEDYCYYGSLLPVLYTIRRKLKDIQEREILNLVPGLAEFTIDAIESRFSDIFNDKDAQLAAVSNPFYKNIFTYDFAEKEMLRNLLLHEITIFEQETKIVTASATKVALKKEKSFFDFEECHKNDSNNDNEIYNYFKFCKTFTDLIDYPNIRKIFLKYNTTLPTSAPVESLFSIGGTILTPKKNNLSENEFEKLLLLRYNNHLML